MEHANNQELLTHLTGPVAAQALVKQYGGLTNLAQASFDELRGVKGIGSSRAAAIKSAFLLAQRLTREAYAESPVLDTPERVADLFVPGTRPLRDGDPVLPDDLGVHGGRVLVVGHPPRHIEPVAIGHVGHGQLLHEAGHTRGHASVNHTPPPNGVMAADAKSVSFAWEGLDGAAVARRVQGGILVQGGRGGSLALAVKGRGLPQRAWTRRRSCSLPTRRRACYAVFRVAELQCAQVVSLTVTIDLPVELERALRASERDLSLAAKEALAVSLFRRGKPAHAELGRALGLDRFETDALLKRHQVTSGGLTLADLEMDRAAVEHVRGPVRP